MCKQDHDIPGVYPKGMGMVVGMVVGMGVGMIGGMGMGMGVGVGTQSLVQLNVSTLYTVK